MKNPDKVSVSSSGKMNRRKFIATGGAAAAVGFIPFSSNGFAYPETSKGEKLYVPLTDPTNLIVEGPHRFLAISGFRGFQPVSLSTKASVKTNIHRGPTGSLSFMFSPLEDLDFYPGTGGIEKEVRNSRFFPLVSDHWPPRRTENMAFGIYWTSSYPQLMGKFALGDIWSQLDYGLASFVYAERLRLRQGCWYFVTLTWDKPAKKLRLYVNGRLMGYYNGAIQFAEAGDQLYIGNPMMMMRSLLLEEEVLDEKEIAARYKAERPAGNRPADQDIREAVDILEKPPLELVMDNSWAEAYSCSFTNPEDLEAWVFQTGDKYRDKFDVRITGEGLLVKTPEQIDKDSRMYLWSPRSFEGDQWIEYDFRLDSPEGLALLVVCCRGPQREDFLLDREMEKTGSMGIILGKTVNYHWEYVRRVEMMRRDVETQYLSKNPWHWRMHYGCIPKLKQGRWYRLRFVKTGSRLHGSIDGNTVFDVNDDSGSNNGPVLNFGRIGLRQMYNTSMYYRNMNVYVKK